MRKLVGILCASLLVFGLAGMSSANLITNGFFDDGLNGWTTSGDVRIGDTNDLLGVFASAQGMVDQYALLGLCTTDETSQLKQEFEVVGVSKIAISFNWAFDYWDNSASAEDTFLSLVRQDGQPTLRISLLDLTTHGTGFFSPDFGLAYGFYTDTVDISAYTTENARLIFRLIEEGDSNWFTGTASFAGVDNVIVSAVPEPVTLLLLGFGLLGLMGIRRKI